MILWVNNYSLLQIAISTARRIDQCSFSGIVWNLFEDTPNQFLAKVRRRLCQSHKCPPHMHVCHIIAECATNCDGIEFTQKQTRTTCICSTCPNLSRSTIWNLTCSSIIEYNGTIYVLCMRRFIAEIEKNRARQNSRQEVGKIGFGTLC